MWIRASVQLGESTFLLSTPFSSHLLASGEFPALFDAGVGAGAPRMIEELDRYLGEERPLAYLFVSHAHFDHIGGLPYLRQRYPQLKVIGSPRTAELLANESKSQELYQRNVQCAAAAKAAEEMDFAAWRKAVVIDTTVRDGDSFSLGDDVEVKVIASPGHTDDSHVFLVRPDAVLAGGESLGGYFGRNKLMPCFTESFDEYQATLEKYCGLELKVIVFPHSGAVSGDLAIKFFLLLREECTKLQAFIQERLAEGQLSDEIAAALYPEWMSQGMPPDGPFVPATKEAAQRMVQVIAEKK